MDAKSIRLVVGIFNIYILIFKDMISNNGLQKNHY